MCMQRSLTFAVSCTMFMRITQPTLFPLATHVRAHLGPHGMTDTVLDLTQVAQMGQNACLSLIQCWTHMDMLAGLTGKVGSPNFFLILFCFY